MTWAGEALAGAKPAVFWSDRSDGPEAAPALMADIEADLVVVGGGYTGLWAAIQALEDKPGLRVVLLEADRCGFGATSRNGGFCDASLTHGLHNGISHWPDDIETLVEMGNTNLDAIEETVRRYRIDADFRRTTDVGVATVEWHLDSMPNDAMNLRRFGYDAEVLDETAARNVVRSPTYLGALAVRGSSALVDPARLCWGLRGVAEGLGALVFEDSRVLSIEQDGRDLKVKTASGTVAASAALLATNAYRGPTRQPRRYVIPVYDHVLVTEPLSAAQQESIGWEGREGIGDVSNQFHYYRMTDDNRILWGGYDATYHFGNGIDASHDQSSDTHPKLADHFFTTFPQLEGLRFTHRWGGPIGTTTRFTPAWGKSHGGQVVWVAGYTGLGVAASRFGARVGLDLLFGLETERTALEMVRRKPFPFPPEPLRWASVELTRKAIQRTDAHGGKRGLWLSFLDRFGIGFDS